MTTTPHSVTIIAPIARFAQIRDFLASQGYELGDGVPMSSDGNEPATHLGAHMWLTAAEARTFTLRDLPARFLDGYTLTQARACMRQFKARNDGSNINYGATPDGSRTARIFLNTDGGARVTKRALFDQVAADVGVQPIESVEPLSLDQASLQRR